METLTAEERSAIARKAAAKSAEIRSEGGCGQKEIYEGKVAYVRQE